MVEFLVLAGYYLAGLAVPCIALFCFVLLANPVERRWYRWEIPLAALPGITYWLLDIVNVPSGKSIANLIEPFILGFAYGLLLLARLVMASQQPKSERILAALAPVLGVLLAVSIFFLTPALPE
jgi:hypothetical protein